MIWKIYFLKLVFSWRNHSNSSKQFFTSQFISIDTFFKKSENQHKFFFVKFFFLRNVICSIMWTKKFFSLERKFFLSPFLKFFLSIKNFFSLYRSKKRYYTFFKKYENQQLFFSKSWLVLFSDFASYIFPRISPAVISFIFIIANHCLPKSLSEAPTWYTSSSKIRNRSWDFLYRKTIIGWYCALWRSMSSCSCSPMLWV